MIGIITSNGNACFSNGIYVRVQSEQPDRNKQYFETQPKTGGLEKIPCSPDIKTVLDNLSIILVELYTVISKYDCATKRHALMDCPEFIKTNKKALGILSRNDLNGYLEDYREAYHDIMKEAELVHQNSLIKKKRGKNGQKIVY